MWAGVWGFLQSLPVLLQIIMSIAKWIRENYEASQRKAVAKEFKAAIQESVKTLDNSRLINLLNPHSEPFQVKKDEKPVSNN